MKRALVFGSFDIIHPGHKYFLRAARRKGRWLIASVARDEFIKSMKGRSPVHTEQERLTQILESGYVKEAYLADEAIGTYTTIERARPDIICLGHDQDKLKQNLCDWLDKKKLDIPVFTLRAYKPHVFKSSTIRKHRSV